MPITEPSKSSETARKLTTNMTTTITIANQKGGVGKINITFTLAGALFVNLTAGRT